MKSTAFWDIKSFSQVEVPDVSEENTSRRVSWESNQQLRGKQISLLVACPLGLLFDPKNLVGTFFLNVGELLPDYTTSHPIR
jgi:hypothetical protein